MDFVRRLSSIYRLVLFTLIVGSILLISAQFLDEQHYLQRLLYLFSFIFLFISPVIVLVHILDSKADNRRRKIAMRFKERFKLKKERMKNTYHGSE